MLAKSLNILKRNGYVVYKEPYRLNIVGYRSRFVRSNRFDDEIHVFYLNDQHKWVYHIFKATTDPGQFWLDNPPNPQGTAFLKKGQYRDSYGIGWHRGVYQALIQIDDVTVIRNYDRKGLFKWFESGKEATGPFGINIHRASNQGTAKVIDSFSAGCLVFANADDFKGFMNLAMEHQKRYGNRFTVSLVDFRDERKRRLRYMAWASALAFGGWLVLNRFN